MPALIGGAIGGIANLIGGAIGSNSSKNAGNVLQTAGNTAATAIQGAAGNASSALQPYINSAQSGIGTAVTGAQGGINSAVTGAQGGIGSAVTGAQGGIGGAVQSGLAGGNTFLQGLSPYQQVGASGASQLNSLLAPGGSINTALNTNFAFNPSDKQGLQAGQNQMTAAGLGNSGAAAKGATSYATGLAGTYFNNAYNRALSTYQNNRQNSLYQIQALMGTAGLGQTANQQALGATEYMGGLGLQGATTAGQLGLQGAETAGGLGLQGATQMGNWQLSGTEAAQQAAMTGAQGKAAGIMGSANAWQNALGGASNSLMGGLALNQMGQNGGYNVYWPSGSTSYDTDTGEYTYGGGG